MAHFVILCPEAGGHLIPMGSLGLELQRRGHRVTVAGLARGIPIVERLGLPFHEFPAEVRSLLRRPPLPLRYALGLLGAWRPLITRYGFRWRAAYLLEFAPAALRELGADALLIDQSFLAGGTVAERLGLPYVTGCSALHWLRERGIPPQFTGWSPASGWCGCWRSRAGYAVWDWYVRPAMRLIARYRQAWDLDPFPSVDSTYSPFATLAQTCPAFDFPRASLPQAFHYIGAFAADRPYDASAFPRDRLDERPLIYASLGTVSLNQRLALFRNIAQACCGLGAQLVISAGRWEKDEHREDLASSSLPGQPLVLPFVPQLALLDKAQLLITHAGQNTVVEALTRGVPMVAAPQGADQFALAARIEHAGVGLRSRSRQVSVAPLRRMVQRVLGEESFRQRAGELQKAMLATGGVRRAADIAEQVCETRHPVLRSKTSE
ncbi:MAG: glycosyltransferase family 1 protein [Victivallales bacterium]|nr:glycosyltransferase family 1 protein [Victivallales bacterium]